MPMDQQERETLRAASREFLAKRANHDRLRRYLEDSPEIDEELWAEVTEQGWVAFALPDHLDGLGGSVSDLAVVAVETGRSLQLSPLTSTLAGVGVLAKYGVLDAHPEIVEEITAGAVVTFPSALDLLGGASKFVTGEKRRVGLVPDAAPGGYLLAPVEHAGAQALVVVALDRGAEIHQRSTIDLVRRYYDVEFDDSAVVATIDDPASLRALFHAAVVLQAAESVGVASAAFEMTLEYAKQRRQFDRVIGSFQVVKHRLADMYIELECAKVALTAAAEAVDTGVDVDAAVHSAKSVVGRAASWITSQAQQLHGGIGFTWEHVLHLYIRRAKSNELLLGSPSWHEKALVEAVRATE